MSLAQGNHTQYLCRTWQLPKNVPHSLVILQGKQPTHFILSPLPNHQSVSVFYHFCVFLSLTQGPRRSADGAIRTCVLIDLPGWFGLGVRSCVSDELWRFLGHQLGLVFLWAYLIFSGLAALCGFCTYVCLPSPLVSRQHEKGVLGLLDLPHLLSALVSYAYLQGVGQCTRALRQKRQRQNST